MAMKRALRNVLFYAVLAAAWVVLAKLKVLPSYLFPAPWTVSKAMWTGFADHSFWIAIGVSLRRMLLGYGLSVVLGIILGMSVASSDFLDQTLGGLLVSLQSLPSICWLPIALLWFGLSEKAILFVVVMSSLLSVTISMETGRKQLPEIYSMAGRNLGARGVKLFLNVTLPASLPYIITGLKQGWAFAWRSLISGEMIFVTLGLGQLLMKGRNLNNMSQVVAVMILIVVLSCIADALVFRAIEKHLQQRWGPTPA
jgi:NitT/TauT family transport system permease protein